MHALVSRLARLAPVLLRVLFWAWNLVGVAVVVFGVLPFVVVDLVKDAAVGLARWDFVASIAILCLVPVATTAYAFAHRKRYREEPAELFELFFGVELPLLAITAGRLYAFASLGHAAEFVYVALVAGGLVAESRLVLGARFPKSQVLDGLSHGFLTLRMVAGVYVGFLLANVTVPLLLASGKNAVDVVIDSDGVAAVVALVLFPATIMAAATLALVLTLPITAPLAWWRALQHSGALVRARWGLDDLLFTSGAPVVIAVMGFIMLVPQPHKQAFALLDKTPTTDDERRALAAAAPDIEAGLVDAWLGRHRYVFDNNNDVWARAWALDLKGRSRRHEALVDVNATFNEIARPFTFDGQHDRDAERAKAQYRAYFGSEIELDHAAAAQQALAARWSRAERFSAFIDEGKDRARLVAQDVVVDGAHGVFDVEVHDVWQNQTPQDLEVTLSFALPVSAAISGVWVSPTAHKEDGAAFTVSPRGAAQQVFEEAKRSRSDKPALVEQVGPGQYRFRVFPIPARTPRSRSLTDAEGWTAGDAAQVHVWLKYQALPDDNGQAPLPLLTSRRNGFWDTDTARVVDGASVAGVAAHGGGQWVQGTSTKTQARQPVMARVPRPPPPRVAPTGLVAVNVDDIVGFAPKGPTPKGPASLDPPIAPLAPPRPAPPLPQEITSAVDAAATPALPPPPPPAFDCVRLTPENAPTLALTGKVVDVVIDRSRGVAPHTAVVKDALARLRASGATVQVILGTNALYGDSARAVDDVNVDALAFVGAATPGELLQQARAAHAGAAADAVVILAGTTSFSVSDARAPVAPLPRTVLLHVSGRMPSGYDDAVLDAIRQSGGTTTARLDDALARLAEGFFVDGYSVDVAADGSACVDDGVVEAVVARAAIALADRTQKAPPGELDRLHFVATKAGVVTPYSSMIVLLNPAQRQRLAQLAQGHDRFTREQEGQVVVGEDRRNGLTRDLHVRTSSAPPPPPMAAVPSTAGAPMKALTAGTADSLAPGSQMKGRAIGEDAVEAVVDTAARAAKDDRGVAAGAKNEIAAAEPGVFADDPVAPAPASPPVQGVPEPHEWLLLMLGLVAVVVTVVRRPV
jgi:hypothetical protein